MNSRATRPSRVSSVFFAICIAYLLFPILIVLPISFSNNDFLQFPPGNFGIRWYKIYFNDPEWIAATILSFRVAVLASLLSTLAGTLAVIALERRQSRLKTATTWVLAAPIFTPHIFIALGIFAFAIRLGLDGSVAMLVAAHATIALPFVVLIVGAAHRQLDPNYELAARVLGAGPLRAFMTGAMPGLLPSIVAAAIFSFFVSFDELIIAEFLLSGQQTLPMRIWADLRLELRPTVAAVSSLLIVVTTLGMGAAEYLRRRAF